MSNPTDAVSLDFNAYVANRKHELGRHLVDGVPDYGFALDNDLRRRMASLRPLRSVASAITATAVPLQKQLYRMSGVAVGPRQLPEIYAVAEDCARRLGIGVPQVFVYPSGDLNAFTIATTDVAPIVVITTALVEAFAMEELKFVIGHECGHIHNLHGLYQTAFEFLANPAAMGMLQLMSVAGSPVVLLNFAANALQKGLLLYLKRWERCAETTSDRAGLICCGDLDAGLRALTKLATGGGAKLSGVNVDELVKQVDPSRRNPFAWQELLMDHPLIPKRIAALKLFASCDVFRSWRPDQVDDGTPVRSKDEVDRLCAEVIDVVPGQLRALRGSDVSRTGGDSRDR